MQYAQIGKDISVYKIELRRVARQKSDADMQKILQDALIKQQAESKQVAEPIRQPKGPPLSLRTKKDFDDYTLAELFRDIGIMSQEDFDSNFPVKLFQRVRPQKPSFSSRIERVEERINETHDTVNQLSDLFQKQSYIQKCEIFNETGHSKSQCPRQVAKSNLTCTYFTPLRPIIPQYTYSDKEQDLNGEDPESKFCGINDMAINTLGWEIDKPSDFTVKGNSKHTSESLGWLTDVPISVKDKNGKTVTATGIFIYIDNGKDKPMLCLGMTWIRKVQERVKELERLLKMVLVACDGLADNTNLYSSSVIKRFDRSQHSATNLAQRFTNFSISGTNIDESTLLFSLFSAICNNVDGGAELSNLAFPFQWLFFDVIDFSEEASESVVDTSDAVSRFWNDSSSPKCKEASHDSSVKGGETSRRKGDSEEEEPEAESTVPLILKYCHPCIAVLGVYLLAELNF
ncbi:hypothetical protein RhiirC2_791512 [Rhizophagus irregularis]|uniref:Uncharacterized protein n=1 Tax=Rhizophagus irregularis TaxID=588596 RepID=A0A2N1MJ42_9GLOM|nr:hypothetical protein RhiirC2_791512 [Rhizophagus irregularis]